MLLPDPASYRFCPICAAPLAPKVVKEGEVPRPWCDACGFVAYSNPRVAACTIAVVDGGIVLLRRANEPQRGKWVFPAGYVDRGGGGAGRGHSRDAGGSEAARGPHRHPRRVLVPGEDVVVVVYAAHVLPASPRWATKPEAVRLLPARGHPLGRAGLREHAGRAPRLPPSLLPARSVPRGPDERGRLPLRPDRWRCGSADLEAIGPSTRRLPEPTWSRRGSPGGCASPAGPMFRE